MNDCERKLLVLTAAVAVVALEDLSRDKLPKAECDRMSEAILTLIKEIAPDAG